MVLTMCFSTVILAGEKIAATSGLAFASQIDPTNGAQSPSLVRYFPCFYSFCFFIERHLVVFELLYKSYDTIPLGTLDNISQTVALAIEASGIIYSEAVLIVLPIVSLLFLMNLG